jgi:hypothetical protein
MKLVRERISQASVRLQEVSSALSAPELDKNACNQLVNEALGILESLIAQPQQTKGN